MKTKSKYGMIIGLIVSLLLLMTQCDKFTELKFLTPNNFTLDASSHEFDVTTKQETSLNTITINGKENMMYLFDKDTIFNYDDYSVRYVQYGEAAVPIEVKGEWFSITKPSPFSTTTHIFIDENNEDTDRSLTINIAGDLTLASDINIKQKGKGK